MLKVRPAQIKVFEGAALRQFEDEMVQHLAKFAPKHCQVIGEPAVRKAIQLGVRRAAKYGLTDRGPVRFYIELMFMFGSDFDTDPQVPWAMAVLKDPALTDQIAKADRLYEQAMDCVEKVAGPEYEYAKRALRAARGVTFEQLPLPDRNFQAAMFSQLKEIHPQKVHYLGERRTKELIAYGQRLPQKLLLAPERGAALCVGAMFALGHGFGDDPLLPWISHTITNPAITDPATRSKRMYSRIMTYLDHILAAEQEANA